jgi:hypothetical protein
MDRIASRLRRATGRIGRRAAHRTGYRVHAHRYLLAETRAAAVARQRPPGTRRPAGLRGPARARSPARQRTVREDHAQRERGPGRVVDGRARSGRRALRHPGRRRLRGAGQRAGLPEARRAAAGRRTGQGGDAVGLAAPAAVRRAAPLRGGRRGAPARPARCAARAAAHARHARVVRGGLRAARRPVGEHRRATAPLVHRAVAAAVTGAGAIAARAAMARGPREADRPAAAVGARQRDGRRAGHPAAGAQRGADRTGARPAQPAAAGVAGAAGRPQRRAGACRGRVPADSRPAAGRAATALRCPARNRRADELDLPAALLAPRRLLEAQVRGETVPEWRGWRGEVLAEALRAG